MLVTEFVHSCVHKSVTVQQYLGCRLDPSELIAITSSQLNDTCNTDSHLSNTIPVFINLKM